jgi:hypothetical protein
MLTTQSISRPKYNAFAAAARAEKVALLCGALAGHISAADAAVMDANCWKMAAQVAGVNMPSAETQQAVIAVLRRNEATRPANPFPRY